MVFRLFVLKFYLISQSLLLGGYRKIRACPLVNQNLLGAVGAGGSWDGGSPGPQQFANEWGNF